MEKRKRREKERERENLKLFALIWFSNSFTFFFALDTSTAAQFVHVAIDFSSLLFQTRAIKNAWKYFIRLDDMRRAYYTPWNNSAIVRHSRPVSLSLLLLHSIRMKK